MESEISINNQILIDSVEHVLIGLNNQTAFRDIDINDVVDFIRNEENTVFFLNDKLEITRNMAPDSVYLWVDTGFISRYGHPLFISMISRDGYFSGHYVGDSKFLSEKAIEFYPRNRNVIHRNETVFNEKYKKLTANRKTNSLNEKYKDKIEPIATVNCHKTSDIARESRTVKHTNEYWEKEPSELVKDLEGILMFNSWSSIRGLDRYIKILGCRLAQLIEQGKNEYFVLNKLQSAIINTGLLDRYGEDIYLMYKKHVGFGFYVPDKIVESKKDYISEGFAKDKSDVVSSLKPIDFFDEGQRTFDADIGDIDLTSRALGHMIEERKNRFPENIRAMSDASIAVKIKSALELGLKLQKRDGSYAKPGYSGASKTISWMLPLHINRDLNDTPELVLVLRKVDQFYEVKTILPYDDELKDKLIDLSLYGRSW